MGGICKGECLILLWLNLARHEVQGSAPRPCDIFDCLRGGAFKAPPTAGSLRSSIITLTCLVVAPNPVKDSAYGSRACFAAFIVYLAVCLGSGFFFKIQWRFIF